MSSYFHKQLQHCVLKRIFIPEGSWNEKTSNTKFAKCQKKDKDTFWCPCVVKLALWSNLSRRAVAEGRCVHAHWTTHPNTLMVPLQHLSCPASRYMSWMAAERGRIWVPALILTAIKPPFPYKKHNSPPLLCLSQCSIHARFAGVYIICHESNQCHFLLPMEQLINTSVTERTGCFVPLYN